MTTSKPFAVSLLLACCCAGLRAQIFPPPTQFSTNLTVATALLSPAIIIDQVCTGWVLGTGWSCGGDGSISLAAGSNNGVATFHSALNAVGNAVQLVMTVSNVAGTGATVSECGAEGTAATTAAIAQTSTFVCSTTEDLQLTPTASSTAAVKISALTASQVMGGGIASQFQSLAGSAVTNNPPNYQLEQKGVGSLSIKNTIPLSLFEGGAGTEWVTTGGTNAVNNTALLYGNTQGITVTATAGANSKIDNTQARNLSAYSAFRLRVYVDNSAGLSNISLYISSDSSYANYYVSVISSLITGWNDKTVSLSTFSTTGSPNLASVAKIRLTVIPLSGQTVNATFAGLLGVSNPNTKGVVLITFDDGFPSQYTTAAQAMAAYGWAATAFVTPSQVALGNPTSMTVPQIQTLQNLYGWDIACHTYNHALLPALPIGSVDAEMTSWLAWASAQNIQRVPVLAYPQGATSWAVEQEVAKFFIFARNASADTNVIFDPYGLQYQFPANMPTNVTTLASLESLVAAAASANSIIILGFHDIETTATSSLQWSTANFNSLLAYIATQSVNVWTFSQLIQAYR